MEMTDASYSDASSGNVCAFTATVQADLLPLLALSYAHFQVRLSCDDVILMFSKTEVILKHRKRSLMNGQNPHKINPRNPKTVPIWLAKLLK